MFLLDEKNPNIIRQYNVSFLTKDKIVIFNKIKELMKNPIILKKSEFPCFDEEIEFTYSYSTPNDIYSPIIRRRIESSKKLGENGSIAQKISSEEISFLTPFTLAFLNKKSAHNLGQPHLDELQRQYLAYKTSSIYIESLASLYSCIEDKQTFANLCLYLSEKPYMLDIFIKTYYPDMAAFREAFSMAILSEEKYYNCVLYPSTIEEHHNIVNSSFSDPEERREALEEIDSNFEQAKSNSEVVQQLKLVPKRLRNHL